MFKFIAFCVFLVVIEAFPVEQNDDESFALENPDLIEGDIIPDDEDDYDRNAIASSKKLWPKGKIPYVISSSLSDKTENIINAMKHIESQTCIRFVKRTKEANYVRIYKGSGCKSKIGMAGKAQDLSLGEGCHKSGTIIHELAHAIGFFHEQTRSDRDDYIAIHWNNIQKGHEAQFEKRKPSENKLLTPYDYESVTHYDGLAFSKDKPGNLMTMTPKKKGVVLQKTSEKVLSKDDIKRIKLLYKC
ncbi:astacin-like metalloprotease toxin 5 [Uloborus diversus]|uniref:astacin-like metalloprotease toxin 5 n=1 Tax=Uloborus diversus TaxID=327109 RepID=UPI002409167F|nr:astacin-like metalloprotease toxin 5 [Uloborus diversus]